MGQKRNHCYWKSDRWISFVHRPVHIWIVTKNINQEPPPHPEIILSVWQIKMVSSQTTQNDWFPCLGGTSEHFVVVRVRVSGNNLFFWLHQRLFDSIFHNPARTANQMHAICHHPPKITLSHWLFFLGYVPFPELRLLLKLSIVYWGKKWLTVFEGVS